ncbi:hypothetical protein (nucleomorph) [Guillardia theta]|uniref:Uncharacterized protein n=1 Tax=Guillardia theta TaxID=55529 RepID=Q98RK8_GUITH|nr:hypothetical protein GTHECHR3073 [Guillardia theta]XP_001713625.1 hypothetical protein GTHECHR1127 [Guillardia theta]AAK39717.1 hypothetical protein [Guillardia theta]AAK39920.1 hypothetical protein [Guillardia theta]|mmetsp:Transcript_2602/g.8693  ORF Transcript_2602/g.8693 Transcript_2602/m.8693 type:complete len:223 (+) Transcript_2602:3275-3943(+)
MVVVEYIGTFIPNKLIMSDSSYTHLGPSKNKKKHLSVIPNPNTKFNDYDLGKMIFLLLILLNSISILRVMENQLYFKMFFSNEMHCPAFGSLKRCRIIIIYAKVSIICCVINAIYSYLIMINYHFFHRFALKCFAYYESPFWFFVGLEWFKLYHEVWRWTDDTGASGEFTADVIERIDANFGLYLTMSAFSAAEYQKIVFLAPLFVISREVYALVSNFLDTE